MTHGWRVVVPVKRVDRAKSRIDLPPAARAAVTRAMLHDTLAALTAAPEVTQLDIVSGDPSLRSVAETHGARLLSPGAATGINAEVAAVLGGGTEPVAIVLGDLPCLTPTSLAEILRPSSGDRPQFVVDAAGTGTTMLLTPGGARPRSAFGAGSAARHATFADRLDAAPPGARRDVDTLEDLAAAAVLGLGPATSAWWAASGAPWVLEGA